MLGLEGKTIAVSGAGSGIGLSVVEHLAKAGAQPILLDLNADNLFAASKALSVKGKPYPSYVCDVASSESVIDVFGRIATDVGPLHGAVASAGVRNFGHTLDITAADWRKVIDINLNGVFYFCREAARACVEANGGSIVSISSVAGFSGIPQRINYCAAKAGVVNMTKVMAIELAPNNVRVNSVAPGATWTALAEQNTPEQRQAMIARTPLGRYADVREISNVVLFLLSDLSSYVTGETIVADGGWSAALM